MAVWKRHYRLANKTARMNLYRGKEDSYEPAGSSKNYRSFLPEVYAGFPNRLDRFRQYDMMENDPEIHAALDILADFCTQNNEDNDGNPFTINFSDETPDTIIETIQSLLKDWIKLNNLDRRIFDVVRASLKYGDYFFVRDPETFELYPANPFKIEKVIVDESKGKEIEQYFIKDLELNLQAQVATASVETTNNYSIPGTAAISNISGSQGMPGTQTNSQMGGSQSSRFINSAQSFAVNAENVIHMSMNSGDDPNWPFGTSVLESIYKTYKQKELLEDAIIIYRIQRAPERRVFKIDVGNLPHHKAMQFVERMKNEMHQRRIPTRDGSGSESFSLMDTAYNPMSILEDFYLPVTADGRGSDITTLPGGESLGQIDDLRFWNNKLIRGLKIPSSYLPFGPDDGTQTHNDGRMGQVLVQEIRFAKYCQRLQNNFCTTFDAEFKRYLDYKGYNINVSDFDLRFNPPMNFAEWTKIEMLNSSISLFTQMNDVPFISKRIAMEEFLQWDEEKIARNARMWREENPSKLSGLSALMADEELATGAPGLQSVGVGLPEDDFGPEEDTENSEGGDDFGNEEGLDSPLGGADEL